MQTEAREHYCLFDTAIGPCGIAWSERGLTRLQLPEADGTRPRSGCDGVRPSRDDPPPDPASDRSRPALPCGRAHRILRGRHRPDEGGPVDREVYEAARSLGWGETASYGELARKIGEPAEARTVGQAMARNPVPIIVPCHRVLASGNRIGGFSASGGTLTKKRLLALGGRRHASAARHGAAAALIGASAADATCCPDPAARSPLRERNHPLW